jgi:hypothetical protein
MNRHAYIEYRESKGNNIKDISNTEKVRETKLKVLKFATK